MHGLIALYLGFAVYLVIFFRLKKSDFLSKKIAVVLALKLLILTLLYVFFFSQKMNKEQRSEKIQTIILE